jgi:hypothetical protein
MIAVHLFCAPMIWEVMHASFSSVIPVVRCRAKWCIR